jgi:uncharacterized protein (TIGR02466 family)
MKPNYVFPTCIGSDSQIELAKELLPVCLEYINSDGVSFNNNNHHLSTYENRKIDNILHNDKRFLNFKNYITSLAKEYSYINNIEYVDMHHFFNINKMMQNSSHTVHTHQGAILSGLIYLKVSEFSSPILFRDPRQYRQFIDYKTSNNTSAIQTFLPHITIPPKVGDVLIWPSWLEHEVPYNPNDDERITLVFNLEK